MFIVICVQYVGGGPNIVIPPYIRTHNTDMWSVLLPLCMVVSNIVIGLYILDMWSVLCVMYVCGGI